MKKKNILDVVNSYDTIGDIPTEHLAAFLDEVTRIRFRGLVYMIVGTLAFAVSIIIQIMNL